MFVAQPSKINPQRAENLTAKRKKNERHEKTTNISKLRKRWKEQQGAKERQM